MTKKLTFEEFKNLFPKTYNQGFMKNADNVKIDGKNYKIFCLKSLETGKTYYSHDPHFFRADLGSEETLEEVYTELYEQYLLDLTELTQLNDKVYCPNCGKDVPIVFFETKIVEDIDLMASYLSQDCEDDNSLKTEILCPNCSYTFEVTCDVGWTSQTYATNFRIYPNEE